MLPATLSLSRLVATVLLTVATAFLSGQVPRQVYTAKGGTPDTPVPHPLSWWTQNPLRLDASGDLMLSRTAPDGHIVTSGDYRIQQKVTYLGSISGHRIVQIMTTIEPGPRLVSLGWKSTDIPPTQWKSLLVKTGNEYEEIYRLQSEYGTNPPLKDAAIYGVGPNAILGTYDRDSGNGGGCDDGYWWFDKAGVHLVDFSPLAQAIYRVIPKNSGYTPNCWALHPEKAELKSWVQEGDPKCHACGGLGMVEARYRIEHGIAIPVSVRFKPDEQP
ncbi:hypothetical protein [Terriglobus saanensis]|uniref:Uncharacterized protein n=1 Tax=Terriglobus saanensis (strain ATCC BAA-1853 / DSM 23119 / SP1PR4) TaxID=401053 RepID=E8V1E6_TERSS|nr:hypothetical protein [Terriglobus saanensis]ADV81141.1 hypothetical protein AciPR4_0304 [Terriglobus saanensis SP1PR4]